MERYTHHTYQNTIWTLERYACLERHDVLEYQMRHLIALKFETVHREKCSSQQRVSVLLSLYLCNYYCKSTKLVYNVVNLIGLNHKKRKRSKIMKILAKGKEQQKIDLDFMEHIARII